MTPERWNRIEELFNAVAELPPPERSAYVERHSNGDGELKQEVLRLLKSLESADDFIESPIWTDSRFLNTKAQKELSGSLSSPKDEEDNFVGQRIGVYRLVRQIGRGGMGAVYQAERSDGEFNQTVAMKLIKRGMDTEFIVRRFRHERQILASFEHPFIARLLDGGTTANGIPYFVMEYIEGETLYHYCDSNKLNLRDRLKIFQKICSAVEYAHDRQVIHRDIKPSNILVNRAGTPKLLDFGIAKILDPDLIHESVNPTGSMLRMMTPDYASPEQVRGTGVEPRSDIYSLGVLLYELLTGHRPYSFAGRALHEVSRVVCEESPVLPSRVLERDDLLLSPKGGRVEQVLSARSARREELLNDLCRGLDNIIMKALAKEPHERYESVKQLTLDISRFLRGNRVLAPDIADRSESALSGASHQVNQAKAIAVLPFKFLNLEGRDDPDSQFLGLGLADALIARLSKIRSLLVRPTSSILGFKATQADPIDAGSALKVDFLVDGSIKKAGDKVRVSIQLLDVRENAAVWATSIDERLSDVLTLEDVVSGKVMDSLVPLLTGGQLADLYVRGTDIPEAFEDYLKGRYYFNQSTEEGLAKSFLFFHSAIAADPNYALAYCGIADYYSWLGIMGVLPPQECFLPAINAARKAVELDANLSEAHATLGFALHAGNYDWASAERHLLRAIELNPGNAAAFMSFSIVLFTESRFTEGLEYATRAVELDPLTPFNQHNVGWGLYYARRYREAAEQYERVIEKFPDYPFGHLGLSKVNRKLGRTKASIQQVQLGNALMGYSLYSRLAEAEAFAADGQIETARQKLDELVKLGEGRYVSPYQIALVYCYLGDTERAILHLEKAADIKEAWLNWLGIDPVFDEIRGSQRVQKILERTGYSVLLNKHADDQSTSVIEVETPVEIVPDRDSSDDLTTLIIPGGPITASSLNKTAPKKYSRSVRAMSAAAFALVAIGIASVVIYFAFAPSREPSTITSTTVAYPSIVVLPFKTGDSSTEGVGVGLADSLTYRLGNLKSLTVFSPNTGRAFRDASIESISSDLKASFVLRGRLDKRDDAISIDAELVNATNGSRVWAQQFVSREADYFALQSQIAEKLWTSLGIDPLPAERQQILKSYTKNVDAYQLYLAARSEMVSRRSTNLRQAISLFAEAVRLDPQFATAYVGLADSYCLLNLYDITPPPNAYELASRNVGLALELDPDLAEAHAVSGYINFYYHRDRSAAELSFRRAIQTNPSYAQAHHWFALVLAAMDRSLDALSEIETAERLDPKSPSIKSAAAIVNFFASQNELGILAADRALSIQPNFVPAIKVKRWIYASEGKWEAARQAFNAERYSAGEPEAPGWLVIEAQLADISTAESKQQWRQTLERAANDPSIRGNDFSYAFEFSLAYAHLGDLDQALKWLERAEAAGTHGFNMIEVDPRLDLVRSHPRFKRLLDALHKKKFDSANG